MAFVRDVISPQVRDGCKEILDCSRWDHVHCLQLKRILEWMMLWAELMSLAGRIWLDPTVRIIMIFAIPTASDGAYHGPTEAELDYLGVCQVI